MTLYPTSKCTPQRAIDMIENYGAERLMVNAAADWGISDPLQTHRAMLEARKRGHTLETLLRVFHNNPATFMGQNPKFKPRPLHVTVG
jgi:predicted metal-dependent TIM-barrel fold hydrolase